MAVSIAGLGMSVITNSSLVLDDATSEIYYAQLVEAESTRTVMAALREVVETRGLFLFLVQRSCRPLFRHAEAGGARGYEPSHPGRTGLGGTRGEDDRGVFTAGE